MNKAKMYALFAWVIAAMVLGAVWAQTNSSASITISTSGVSGGLAEIDTTNLPATPDWDPIEGAVGTVTAGHLYGIHVGDTGRYRVEIFYTNVDDLVQAYSYLNLKIKIYEATYNSTSDTWTEGSAVSGAEEYITLSSGRVVLYVSGNTHYLVKMEEGTFYCTETSNSDNLNPSFYILVDQA